MKILITSDWHFGFTQKTCDRIKKMLTNGMNQGFDIMVIAGDISSVDPSQMEKAFKHAREVVDKPILVVFGNHDYWVADANRTSLNNIEKVERSHEEICEKYNIHYLPYNPYHGKGFSIYGFDGWYGGTNPITNDANWMSREFGSFTNLNRYFFEKQMKQFKYIAEGTFLNPVNILVTHFNIFPSPGKESDMSGYFPLGEIATGGFDYIIYGHTHMQEVFEHKNDTLVINPGSNYDNPKFIIIDILDDEGDIVAGDWK